MKLLRLAFPVVAVILIGASLAQADDLLPPDKPIEQVVDHYIDAKLKEVNVTAAAPADDANLIRRLTLDLVGRIPTVAETKAFVAATEADKRVKLVERLMASSGFVRHQATEFDTLLMAGTRGSVREYLLRAFADNRPWNQIFREVLLSDHPDPQRKGADEFLKQRVKDLDKLTTEVSTIFFGVNISCAQCHDHPKVPDWKQDHFYGMKSFFNRTVDNGGLLAEREFGLVKFKTTKGEEKQAKLMFLTGKTVDAAEVREPTGEEQRAEKQRLDEAKSKKIASPAPKFSARAQLVEVALQQDQQDFFARSIANRVWYRLFGQGLVMPIDQMHSENTPSHPELLQWLARDVATHQYDLRRLIRGLVLSQAYARSSRWESEDLPKASLFAVAKLRALTPMQMALSLRVAASDPNAFGDPQAADFEKRLESFEASARGLINLFEQPSEDFQIGVSEALLFSNNDRIMKDLLADNTDRLMGRLKQIKDRDEQIALAVQSVLSRPIRDEEKKALSAYLASREDRPVEACRQLVWALLTSSEFRFNY